MGPKTRRTLLSAIAALVLAIAAVSVALASSSRTGRAAGIQTAVTDTSTVGTTTSSSGGSALPPGYTNDNSARNRMAAAADAKAHLKLIKLPAGSVRLSHRPKGDNGYLAASGSAVDTAVANGWWIVPVSPRELIRYVTAHRPVGSTVFMGDGFAGNTKTGTSARSVAVEWRLEKDKLGSRTMQITATRLNDDRTGVLVEAESGWWVLRSIKEWMPQTAARVQIHVDRWYRRSAVNVTLNSAAKARQVAVMVNSFPLASLGMMCAMILAGPRMTATFFNSAGNEIGQIGFMEWPGKLTASDSCSPVSFTLGGKQMDPLIGGRFMWKLQKLAGHSLIGPVKK